MLWSIIQLAGVLVMLLTRLAYRPLLEQRSRMVVGHCILRWPVLTGMLLLPMLAAATGWQRYWPLELAPLAAPAGSLLLAYACWLFWRSQHDLLLQAAGTLQCQSGVYRRIRHPLYAALWLAALAQLLLLQDGLAASGVLALLLCYRGSVRREEGEMLRRAGPAYRLYMQQTGRLWPRGLAA
ncbi:DUF1295 domain-containing protein [Aquitalea sp. ASV15]|uniref:DUF1295 domain-containing protein n=1 Tax=Aquitalea sp. ASV15 TaxID=2795104 RepID=UPI0018EE3657|nr:DUF1295 domain-containing protein [Aquitalea sp. ASV15]